MRLKDIEIIFHKELGAQYGKEEVNIFFNWAIEHYLKLKPLDLIMYPEYTVAKEEEQLLFEALSQLKLHKPIQYILGLTEFYGLPFKVNQHTLIPRPETEELVAKIISDHQDKENVGKLKILDIGTGSGSIAISLAKHFSNAEVAAIDISEEAISTATQNAKLNDVNVSFSCIDILTPEGIGFDQSPFDIIVSNPPYVRESEKREIRPNVLEHEPHQALFVSDEDPLVFYLTICEFAIDHLKPRTGLLYFEINEYLGKETVDLVKSFPFDHVELIQDMTGKDRMLKALRS